MAQTATILPTSTVHNDGVATGEATAHECLDDSNGNTSRVDIGSDGYVSCGYSSMPNATGIASFTANCNFKYTGPGASGAQQLRLFVVIGGVNYYGSYEDATIATYHDISKAWTLNPATSLPWTQAQVNAITIGAEYSSSGSQTVSITYLAGTVSYTPVPASVEVTRHLGSLDLHLKRRPENFGAFAGDLDVLNVSLLGAVDLEHTMGPHATDVGWEPGVWQRRPFAVQELTIEPNRMSVNAKIKDQRRILCLVRDLAWSSKASGSLGDGISRFSTPGSTWSFTRASAHTFTNPVGESETVTINIPAYGSGGLYMLSAAGGVSAPRYYVTNNSGARTWNAAQGTFQCEVNLAAVSAVANQAIAYCYHDASNWAYVYWDGPNGRWVFEVRQAGTTYRATKSATPSSATWYQVGARWTGANLENDDPAYTLSIFIDGVKGTDATAGGAMTQAASSNLDFGSKAAAGTEQLNGQIRKIHSHQIVFTDTEMARAI